MKLFGLELKRVEKRQQLHAIDDYRGGWRRILEPFSGAWQMNVEEKHCDVLCYPTLYACLNRIAQDIGKIPFVLSLRNQYGVWNPTENPSYSPVLRKPNHYQTAQQFREAWALSRLIHGNSYILKGRDNRGVVNRLYVLDPCNVLPMVSDSGDVYYQLNYSYAANLLPLDYPNEQLTIPASEIIHDRLNCFHHQLIGVPPVCAAHWPAVKNLKILKSSAEFFTNNAQPGGILTAPAGMTEADAAAVQAYWQNTYTGSNAGKVAVIGADMKFTSFAMKSADSQLVEQMRYSDEQICQPFGIPPFKIGIGSIPAGLGVDAINLLYYDSALQSPIQSMETLMTEGLGVSLPMRVDMDEDVLMRMDVGKQTEVQVARVKGMIAKPDEARLALGYDPTEGGDTLWGQQQDYPLGILANRAEWDPEMQPEATAPEAPMSDDDMDNEMDEAA